MKISNLKNKYKNISHKQKNQIKLKLLSIQAGNDSTQLVNELLKLLNIKNTNKPKELIPSKIRHKQNNIIDCFSQWVQ